MNHYVYLLIDDTNDMFYIGARSCKCAIEKDKYMGSSKSMTKEQKSLCDKLVLEEFDTREEAISYEIELHNMYNVAINPKFYNKAKQTSVGFDTTGVSLSEDRKAKIKELFLTIERTDSWKENIRKAKTGLKATKEHREAVSKGKLGVKLSDEHKQAISKGGRGRVLSEEHKRKISESNKGRKISDEARKKVSAKLKGRVPSFSPTRHENIECLHCHKIGMKANMKRYHFDKCKEKPCQ